MVHKIRGKVVRGNSIGRKLGFPTANIPVAAEMPVQDGVYAAEEVKAMVACGHGYISPEPRTRGVLDGLMHGAFPHFGMKAEVPEADA